MNKKKPLQFVLKQKSLGITDEIFNFPSISLQIVFPLIACILFLGHIDTSLYLYWIQQNDGTWKCMGHFFNPRYNIFITFTGFLMVE